MTTDAEEVLFLLAGGREEDLRLVSSVNVYGCKMVIQDRILYLQEINESSQKRINDLVIECNNQFLIRENAKNHVRLLEEQSKNLIKYGFGVYNIDDVPSMVKAITDSIGIRNYITDNHEIDESNKISLIKRTRQFFACGLVHAKEAVEKAIEDGVLFS